MLEGSTNLTVDAKAHVNMKRNYPDESDEHVIARLLSNVPGGQAVTRKRLDEISEGTAEAGLHILCNELAKIRKYPDESYGSIVDRIIRLDKEEDVMTSEDLRDIEESLADARNTHPARTIHEAPTSSR